MGSIAEYVAIDMAVPAVVTQGPSGAVGPFNVCASNCTAQYACITRGVYPDHCGFKNVQHTVNVRETTS